MFFNPQITKLLKNIFRNSSSLKLKLLVNSQHTCYIFEQEEMASYLQTLKLDIELILENAMCKFSSILAKIICLESFDGK